MIDQNTQLEAGGRVRISGVWHPLEGGDIPHITVKGEGWTARAIVQFIEEYEPPKPKAEPFPWTDGLLEGFAHPHLDAALTERQGDPTHRTYANENAEDFGLLGSSDVLLWACALPDERWIECEFRHLEEGDVWRLQPAAPKGGKV